jgi:hypothetical protein
MPEKEIGNFFIELGLFITGGVVWIVKKVFGMNTRLTAVEQTLRSNREAWLQHLSDEKERNNRVDANITDLNKNVATIAEGVKHNSETGGKTFDVVTELLMNSDK